MFADFAGRMKTTRVAVLLAVAGGCGLAGTSAMAADKYANTVQALGQSEFRELSKELGGGVAFKGVVPAEGLGLMGFDISASATGFKLSNRGLWSRASNGAKIDNYVAMGGVRVHKGLPYNVDVDAFYNKASHDIANWGGGVRWAFIEGSTLLPAVAVRGSFSKLSGVDQVKMTTKGLDLSVSKGILMFTPYAGVGKVWVDSTPQGIPGLTKESFSLNRRFVGININLGLNLAAEVDRTGNTTSYSVKAGIRF